MANGREPMKVVIINTKYIETDATSFKSVVQELTGKDSSAVMSSSSAKPRSRFYNEQMNISKLKEEESGINGRKAAVGTGSRGGGSILMKNLSFKEFDRLLKDMPTVDDLLWNME